MRAAGSGDETAEDILRRASDELVRLVDRLVALLDTKRPQIGLGGGLLDAGNRLALATRGALASRDFDVLPDPLDALEGARRLALTTVQ
jgi:N-acetylglucosamine kinase-like BadF-type ATPase